MEKVRKTIVLDSDNYIFLIRLSGALTQAMAEDVSLSRTINLIVELLKNLRILEKDFNQNVLQTLINVLGRVNKQIPELNLENLIILLEKVRSL